MWWTPKWWMRVIPIATAEICEHPAANRPGSEPDNRITTEKQTMAKKVNIKPLGDRVLVKPIAESEQVKGGIIIPDSAKEKPTEAEVVAIGTGKKDDAGKAIPFEVKVGDRVIISKYGGTEVKIDDQKYQLLREDDILGIIG